MKNLLVLILALFVLGGCSEEEMSDGDFETVYKQVLMLRESNYDSLEMRERLDKLFFEYETTEEMWNKEYKIRMKDREKFIESLGRVRDSVISELKSIEEEEIRVKEEKQAAESSTISDGSSTLSNESSSISESSTTASSKKEEKK